MKKLNFGKYGWILIIIMMLVCFSMAYMVSTLSAVVPVFSERFGCESSYLMSFSAYAGFITAISCVIFSAIIAVKKRARAMVIVCLALVTGSMVLWGFSTTPTQYFICYTVLSVGITGAGAYGMPLLLGNWFPKKKGIVIGIVTVGNNFGTMLTAVILSAVWTFASFEAGFIVLALGTLVAMVLLLLFIKEKPELQGCFPDNDPSSVIQNTDNKAQIESLINRTNRFSIKHLLKSKLIWKLIFANGLFADGSYRNDRKCYYGEHELWKQ